MDSAEIMSFIKSNKVLPYSGKNTGAYSTYFDFYNGIGAKIVMKWSLSYELKPCKTKKELLKSRLWKAAQREVRFLKKAQNTGIAPKFYALTAVKVIGITHYDDWYGMTQNHEYSWLPAIWMEHIKGMKLDVFFCGEENYEDGTSQIKSELRKKMRTEAHLQMGDIQEDNIFVIPAENDDRKIDKIRVIDFSPPFVKEVG